MFPTIDYETNRKAFKTRTGCLWMFGVLVVLIGLPWFTSGGWFFVIAGVAMIVGFLVVRPTGPESIDEAVKSVVAFATEQAPKKLGLSSSTQEIEPIVVWGYQRSPLAGFELLAAGVRTSIVNVLIAYFSADQVHIYELAASIVQSDKRIEKTVEFFYRDVISLSSQTGAQGTKFTLSAADGRSYECPALEASNLDAQIAAARDLIRSKKG